MFSSNKALKHGTACQSLPKKIHFQAGNSVKTKSNSKMLERAASRILEGL